MSAKHTPGPWSMEFKTRFSGTEYFNGVCGPNGETIRAEGLSLTSGEEARANSQLIAAAPELLAFAELIVTNFQPIPFDPANELFVKLARSLIDKATGDSPC